MEPISKKEIASLPIKNYTPKEHIRVTVNPITIVLVVLSLLVGRFSYFFIHCLVAFLHELCHVLMAKAFKVQIDSLAFLPFGFYAKMNSLERENLFTQFLIVIAGPLSIVLALAVFKLLLKTGIFSYYSYSYGVEAAWTVLLFNLIPLYPLDGARLVEILVARRVDEYKTRILRIVVSLLAYMFLFYISIKNDQIMVLVFLTISTLIEVITFKKQYMAFLMYRLIDSKKRPLKIVKRKTIYRYFDNRSYENDRLLSEKEITSYLLSRLMLDSRKE